MGIYSISQAVFQAVGALQPKSLMSTPFRGLEPGVSSGEEPNSWVENPNRETREFRVGFRSTPTNTEGLKLQASLEIQIVYRLDESDPYLTAYEDVGLIVQALRDPSSWGGADSLWTDGAATTSVVSADGRGVTLILSIPFIIYYVE